MTQSRRITLDQLYRDVAARRRRRHQVWTLFGLVLVSVIYILFLATLLHP